MQFQSDDLNLSQADAGAGLEDSAALIEAPLSGNEASLLLNEQSLKQGAFAKAIGLMDLVGVLASTLCMIHCLLLPLIFALLPVFARPLMENDLMHVSLAGFVLAFCLLAYIPGYLRHRDNRLIWIAVLGLMLVFFATFVARAWGEIVEAAIITAGNTIIIFGHLLNRRLLQRAGCCKH